MKIPREIEEKLNKNSIYKNNKKQQHYVWESYLKPWTVEGKVFFLRNRQPMNPQNPEKVAKQNYFYDIGKITSNDCWWIRELFIRPLKNHDMQMKNMLEGWLSPIEPCIRAYEKFGHNNEIAYVHNKFFRQTIEFLHEKFEHAGIGIINKLLNYDMSPFNDDELKTNFYIFTMVQYYRTKRMKDSMMDSFAKFGPFDDIGAAWNLIVPIIATRVAYINTLEAGYEPVLIKNPTCVPFITGDQPVVNTYADRDEGVEILDNEYYYPLSPNCAILLTKKQYENNVLVCSDEQVSKYNKTIANLSHELIFSNNSYVLEQFISLKY